MIKRELVLKAERTPNGTYRLIGIGKEGNLSARMDECYDLHDSGDYRGACVLRSNIFPHILKAIDWAVSDNGGPITLDRNHPNTVVAMEFIHTSAIDSYLMGLCELAAAQLELLIDCDDEDPLQATPTLALCYVAISDWENLEAIEMDLDNKKAHYPLVRLCRLYAQLGVINEEDLQVLKRYHPHLCKELLLEEHPTDEAYLDGIMVEPPKPEALAREIYLRCERALSYHPAFVEALCQRLRDE